MKHLLLTVPLLLSTVAGYDQDTVTTTQTGTAQSVSITQNGTGNFGTIIQTSTGIGTP